MGAAAKTEERILTVGVGVVVVMAMVVMMAVVMTVVMAMVLVIVMVVVIYNGGCGGMIIIAVVVVLVVKSVVIVLVSLSLRSCLRRTRTTSTRFVGIYTRTVACTSALSGKSCADKVDSELIGTPTDNGCPTPRTIAMLFMLILSSISMSKVQFV